MALMRKTVHQLNVCDEISHQSKYSFQKRPKVSTIVLWCGSDDCSQPLSIPIALPCEMVPYLL